MSFIGYNLYCPCKGCSDRSIGCHSGCRLYSLYKENAKIASNNEKEYRSIDREKTQKVIDYRKKYK